MKKTLAAAAFGVAAALTLTACNAPQGDAGDAPAVVEGGDLDALVEAAKAEGSLRIYGQIPEESMTAVVGAFTEKYGIEVQALRLGGNTLAQRFDTEVEAGTPSGELIIAVDVEYLNIAAEAGHVMGFSESGVADYLEGFPEDAVFEDYDAPLVQVLDTGFIYNTKTVDADDVPTTWDDLSDPDWKGRFCAVDPATSVNVAHFFWDLREREGEDAVAELGENVGRWYPNIIAMNEAVAVGECELGLNSAKFFVANMQGNDATVEFAAQPTVIPPLVSAAVAAKADHPNAARLFLRFLLSEEGNRILNDPEVGALGPWDTAELPEGFSAPKPTDFQGVRDSTSEIVDSLGL